MKKLIAFVALVFLLGLSATPAYANGIPALPHAFYGSVTIKPALRRLRAPKYQPQ